jgi:hypothetical protein
VIILTIITVDSSNNFSHTLLLLLLALGSIKAAVGGLGGGVIFFLNAIGSEEHLRLFTTETVFSP